MAQYMKKLWLCLPCFHTVSTGRPGHFSPSLLITAVKASFPFLETLMKPSPSILLASHSLQRQPFSCFMNVMKAGMASPRMVSKEMVSVHPH